MYPYIHICMYPCTCIQANIYRSLLVYMCRIGKLLYMYVVHSYKCTVIYAFVSIYLTSIK
jgi:hypothetical protein